MTTASSVPLYRTHTTTATKLADIEVSGKPVKELSTQTPQQQYAETYRIFDEGLWPFLRRGPITLVLRRGKARQGKDPNKEWGYWWDCIGVDPDCIPAEYLAWLEETGQTAAKSAASTAPAQPSQGQGGTQQAPKATDAAPRPPRTPQDATRVSIERQVSLKCAADITTASMPYLPAEVQGDANAVAAYAATIAEALYQWLTPPEPEQPK